LGELAKVFPCQVAPVDLNARICDKEFVSTRELIEKEVTGLPESLQREVYDFARFLQHKKNNDSFDGLLLSESVLAKDWNTPEEDAAWASL
jgi:Protein of unknown function (DUF2281)